MTRRLTDAYVQSLTCPAGKQGVTFTDPAGRLSIWVSRTGTKVWRYQYRFATRPNPERIKIGEWPAVAAGQARRAAQEYDQALAEGRDPKTLVYRPADAATLADVLDHHLASLRPDTAKNVTNLYRDLRKAHGCTLARDVSPLLMKKWITANYAHRPGAAANLIRNVTAAFNRALHPLSDIALPAGYANPTAKLAQHIGFLAQRSLTGYATAWGGEDWRRLREGIEAAYRTPHIWPPGVMVIELLSLTGARPSEITTLKWSEVRLVHLSSGLQVEAVKREHKTRRKTGKPRHIPLGREALRVLERAAAHREVTGYTGEYVFPQRRSQRNQKREHVHQLTHYAEQIAAVGGPSFVPYQLRSAYINHALEATGGERLEEVAENVGHTDTRTTMTYYRQLRAERLAETAQIADRAFSRISSDVPEVNIADAQAFVREYLGDDRQGQVVAGLDGDVQRAPELFHDVDLQLEGHDHPRRRTTRAERPVAQAGRSATGLTVLPVRPAASNALHVHAREVRQLPALPRTDHDPGPELRPAPNR